MSVQRRERAGGVVWRVLWRDEGGRQRSRTFSLKRDADAYDAKVKLAKRQGELAELGSGKETLREFMGRWEQLYAHDHLSEKTRQQYKQLADKYLLPALGHVPLRSLSVERIQDFSAKLLKGGAGRETVRKTLTMLQGILERAVEWGRIPRNPARSVKKPSQGRTRRTEPLAPAAVERIRRDMFRREWYRDAALVSALAYAGLRPGEALALHWDDVGKRVLHVERALALGEEAATKTGKTRSVRILKPLADDLEDWRNRSAPAAGGGYIFPTSAGTAWQAHDWRNWRRRRFAQAVKAAGLPATTRPYDLRHSFASLLLAEQMNPIEVAVQLGHTPATLFSTYAHVIEELRGHRRATAETVISNARRSDVAQKLPKG